MWRRDYKLAFSTASPLLTIAVSRSLITPRPVITNGPNPFQSFVEGGGFARSN